ncbi:MAG TPA: DUF971 domain-containing protein [Nevskiaceae bacterium]|nr:DUF971 domain-containing protein [Nevskiaceae bacterium]
MTTAAPTTIKAHRKTHVLELTYADGRKSELPFEYLRVFSPSAEVRGHGGGEPTLVPGKHTVGLLSIEAVGRYAVRLVFDDGHDTGIYSWDIFAELAAHQNQLWPHYLQRLQQAGMSRDSDVVTLAALGKGHHHPAQ